MSSAFGECSGEVVILNLTLKDHVDVNVDVFEDLGVNGNVELQISPLESDCECLIMVKAQYLAEIETVEAEGES